MRPQLFPSPEHPILWAVQPGEEDAAQTRVAASIISAIAKRTDAELRLVSVEARSEFEATEADPADVQLAGYLQILERSHLRSGAAAVINAVGEGTEVQTLKLVEYARSIRAALIVVGNHGRWGLARIIFGSFSETLMMTSALPVLVVGPHAAASFDLRRIFVPTDFTPHSQWIFHQTCVLARTFGAQVTLYHAIPDASPAGLDFGDAVSEQYDVGGEVMGLREFQQHQLEQKRLIAKGWIAEEHDVEIKCTIEVSADESDRLIDKPLLNSQADLVILETHSSAARAAWLGSISRHLARKAGCPVLVFSPHCFDQPSPG